MKNNYIPIKITSYIFVLLSAFIACMDLISPFINYIFYPLIIIEFILLIIYTYNIKKHGFENAGKVVISKIMFFLLLPTIASLFIYLHKDTKKELVPYPELKPRSSFNVSPVDESKDPDGSYNDIAMGMMYCTDIPEIKYREINYGKALEHFKRAALNGNSFSYHYIGNLYYHGYGVEQDFHTAKLYYEDGCKAHVAEACKCLSDLYKEKEWKGYDEEKSNYFLDLAIQYGHLDVIYNNAADSLSNNKREIARILFEKAADKGHKESVYMAAILSLDSLGKDSFNMKWIEALKKENDARGFYLSGICAGSASEKLKEFTKAADIGYTTAQLELAKIYSGKSDILSITANNKKAIDIDKSIHYCEMATRNGNEEAGKLMIELRKMKREGNID